jgi:glycerol-3-phosphate acyltransferase PlsY
MAFDPVILLYPLGGYLLGSMSTAIIVCKLMRLPDPRAVGSNNPGATNVLRHGGKKAAIITLFGDMLKGLLAVLLANQFSHQPEYLALAGTGAFLGHLYPLYFGFKGGKGVATFYGVLLGFNWLAGVAALCVWLLVAFVSRYSSLSALLSAASAPFFLWLLDADTALLMAAILMSALLYWRHRSNMQNLISGRENKIGEKKALSE